MSLPDISAYKDSGGAAWVLARNGDVPPNAVHGGHEANGEILYIARFVTKEGQLAPGKLNPRSKVASNGDCWSEQTSDVYQVLTHPDPKQLKWVPSSGSNLPTGALRAGGDASIYIGRAPLQGGVCCGKFEPDHGCVYLPWGGRQNIVVNNFEVLCLVEIRE